MDRGVGTGGECGVAVYDGCACGEVWDFEFAAAVSGSSFTS